MRSRGSRFFPFSAIIFIGLVFLFSAPAWASFHVKAKSAILMNVNTGKILFAQNPDKPSPGLSHKSALPIFDT